MPTLPKSKLLVRPPCRRRAAGAAPAAEGDPRLAKTRHPQSGRPGQRQGGKVSGQVPTPIVLPRRNSSPTTAKAEPHCGNEALRRRDPGKTKTIFSPAGTFAFAWSPPTSTMVAALLCGEIGTRSLLTCSTPKAGKADEISNRLLQNGRQLLPGQQELVFGMSSTHDTGEYRHRPATRFPAVRTSPLTPTGSPPRRSWARSGLFVFVSSER